MSSCASHCRLPGPPPETTTHEANALFDQPAGQQTAASVVVGLRLADAVQIQRLLRFGAKIENRRRFGLHFESEIVGVHTRRELGIVRPHVGFVQIADQVDGVCRRSVSETPVGRSRLQHRPLAGAEHRRLIDGRQKAVGVHRLAGFERAFGRRA